MLFQREQVQILNERFQERPEHLIIVAGPRQIGKTTLVRQAIQKYKHFFISVDPSGQEQALGQTVYLEDGREKDGRWLIETWQQARRDCDNFRREQPDAPFIFVIDEIQKIKRWHATVKGLWDADRAQNRNMHVVLLGSSPLLIQKGLTESLMGRYELVTASHWSFLEMHQAFDFTLDEYIYFGGYPGSAKFIRDENRWRNYVLNTLVFPSIETDVLQMARVDKPELLRQLFKLGSQYSGQILALNKVKGELKDAGNETTLAGYLALLNNAGLLVGLHKYSVSAARQRASPPKFNVRNAALMSSGLPYTLSQAKADRSYWGRLVESAVGAHLFNTAASNEQVSYWRESPHEVDFVINDAVRVKAIEVKSGSHIGKLSGLNAFQSRHPKSQTLLVGTEGIAFTEFLSYPLVHWLDAA